MKVSHIISLFFIVFIINVSNAQQSTLFGAAAAGNVALKTGGLALRAQIPLGERFELVPQFRYFPKFNKVHEFYEGLNLHYSPINVALQNSNLKLYVLAGMSYNRWIDYQPSLNDRAKRDNFLPETGAGLNFGMDNIRFFAEAKYNPFWKESTAEIGVLFAPKRKSRNGRGGAAGAGRRSSTDCPIFE